MQTKNNSHEKKRLDEVNRAIAGQPEYVMEQHREPILRSEVVLGMTPFEAKLAGGAYAYQVKPDETVWPKKCDPLKVMWSQSIRPDRDQRGLTKGVSFALPLENHAASPTH